MTFAEYIAQQDPKRHPVVDVKREDCYAIFKTGVPGVEGIILNVHNGYDTYRKEQGCETLYTTDADGNKKARSVFRLID